MRILLAEDEIPLARAHKRFLKKNQLLLLMRYTAAKMR